MSSHPSSASAPAELRRLPVAGELLRERGALLQRGEEDAVLVGVGGDAVPAEDVAQDREVAGGVLLLAEEGAKHLPRGVVDRGLEREEGTLLPEPAGARAVELEQHPRRGAAVAALAVAGRAVLPGARQAGRAEDALHARP